MPAPDLSALPLEDLQALSKGNLQAVSEPSLHYLAGTSAQQQTPSIKPNTGLAGPLGTAVETLAAPFDAVASGASHATMGAVAPVIAAGARIYANILGHDPDAAAAKVHQWMAGHTYNAVTPAGKAVGNAANQTLGDVAAPFNAAGGAIRDAAIKLGADPKAMDSDVAAANDYVGAASTLLPAGGAAMDALHGVGLENPANVAKTGAEIGNEAGYRGLQSQQDLKLPGAQAITDKLISDEAKLPQGQMLNTAAVQDARKAGPGKGYDAAKASVPTNVTQDPQLQADIQNIGDTTSQLPRSPDVDALRQHMLGQPDMTNDQLFANIQQARQQGSNNLAADAPDKNALGSAQIQLANAYEDFAGRQLAANPNATTTLEQFQQDRTDMAKSYAAEAALKGGEHIDPMAYARAHAAEPKLLTGNSAIVGRVTAALPPAPAFGTERGLVHGVGLVAAPAAGAAAAHLFGLGPAGDILGAAGGSVASPYIARALHNLMGTGDLSQAGATAANPALSYMFPGGEPEPGFNRTAPTPPPAPPQRFLPAPPTVNAGGGATTPNLLDQLGLTPDVQRAGLQHPGAAAEGPLPPEHGGLRPAPAAAEPPLTQNWAGAGPDGVPNFSLESALRGTPLDTISNPLNMGQHADVLSGHPTPTTGTGGPEGTIDDIIQSALFKQNSGAPGPKARASRLPAPRPLGEELAEYGHK